MISLSRARPSIKTIDGSLLTIDCSCARTYAANAAHRAGFAREMLHGDVLAREMPHGDVLAREMTHGDVLARP